jgi:hypothetical protein
MRLEFVSNVETSAVQSRMDLQDWNRDCHNGNRWLRKGPDSQVNARVGDVRVGHVDHHYRFDDTSDSSNGTQAHSNSHSELLTALHGKVLKNMPWKESQHKVQDRGVVGGEQLELRKLLLVPTRSLRVIVVHLLEWCAFRKTEDPYEVHRNIDLT